MRAGMWGWSLWGRSREYGGWERECGEMGVLGVPGEDLMGGLWGI